MSKIVEAETLVKTYHRGSETIRALNGIDLAVATGEFLAIVGPSGSGKTTLLNLLGCLDVPSAGKLIVDGLEVAGLKPKDLTAIRSRTVGFAFQQFFLFPTLTALENVELPSIFGRKNSHQAKAKELLEIVGLGGRENHRPSQLSGGEMQRVAIARSLINSPKLLLADEPTGNLDSENASAIFTLLQSLNQNGLTVIMVTHNHELAGRAYRVIRLKDGRIMSPAFSIDFPSAIPSPSTKRKSPDRSSIP
jgi:ABC-type lipoprotein export system ATPase subunit